MQIITREVRNYITPEGRNPFRQWLTQLRDKRTRANIRDLQKNKLECYKCQPQRGGMSIEIRQTQTLLAPAGRHVYRT